MDVFLEQIVAKKNTGTDILKRVGVIIAALLIIFISTFILPVIHQIFVSLNLIIIAATIYGAWYLWSSFSVEYEYILTNGEIDIDKIIARRKRKRLITVNTRQFTEFGLYHPQEHVNQQFASTILACSSMTDPNTYYAVFDHPKFGKTMLIFNPNEKIIETAKQFIKRNAIK